MLSLFRRGRLNPREKLREVLGDYDLPSFPVVSMEVLEKIRSPQTSAGGLAKILARDPGLSVQTLRLANSAAFSPRHKIENLGQAVTLMGLSQLESLVMSVAVRDILPRSPAPGFDATRFWAASGSSPPPTS